MALYQPPPDPKICLECGGKIFFIDINEPLNEPRGCDCPNCMVIGPGHTKIWVPDNDNHICQDPPDLEAIAKAKAEFEDKWPELTKAIKQIAEKNKTN